MAARESNTLLDAAVSRLALGLLRGAKRIDRRPSANFVGAMLRKIGPRLKEHRIGRDNLRAAFPEKSGAEIEQILGGVWDNLGRVVAELAHLDEFRIERPGSTSPDALIIEQDSLDRHQQRLDGPKGTVNFAGHLANWEIGGLAAKLLGTKSAILYRRPNVQGIADAVVKARSGVMGELVPGSLEAPMRLARLIEEGVQVGVLVDQHYTKGVDVTFFGRPCKANPLVAALARRTDCPIYGVRVVRLPDSHRFSAEIVGPIEPQRDPSGRINIQGTMQIITNVVEGWVREHPEQWLWLHRRWR